MTLANKQAGINKVPGGKPIDEEILLNCALECLRDAKIIHAILISFSPVFNV